MNRVLNPATGRLMNDLTGDKFGRWTVIGLSGKRGFQTTWRCSCECGTVKEDVIYGALTNGNSNSCGCLRLEQLKVRATSHGKSKGRIYHCWQQIRDRCYNESRKHWPHYGGRGIKVCDRWNNSFEAFAADMGEPPYGTSIDRIDNNGHYEPGNCRWATVQEQARNRQSNRWFDWKGEKRTLTDIARMEGVAFCSMRNRVIQNGATPEQAVNYCRNRGLTFKERAQFMIQ